MAMTILAQIMFLPGSQSEGKAGVCLSIPGTSPELTLTELAAVPLFTFYQLQDFTQVLGLREEPHSDVENESWGGGWIPK